ncbi:uncharacterized protein LOC131023339 [Salvia miltiorrhiza]|uniref:uncharacterized protein LOC131023339 n=1 Tax=Salvia miltiorrhiza TaxID=226208 RepID=UPI0025AB925A|nr:uncharacterized protein LOC131023339 [Salvia miltiorrhiza]
MAAKGEKKLAEKKSAAEKSPAEKKPRAGKKLPKEAGEGPRAWCAQGLRLALESRVDKCVYHLFETNCNKRKGPEITSYSQNSSLPQNARSPSPQNDSPAQKIEVLNSTNATNSPQKSAVNQTSSVETEVSKQNQSQIQNKVKVLKPNQITIPATKPPEPANPTANLPLEPRTSLQMVKRELRKRVCPRISLLL